MVTKQGNPFWVARVKPKGRKGCAWVFKQKPHGKRNGPFLCRKNADCAKCPPGDNCGLLDSRAAALMGIDIESGKCRKLAVIELD